MPGAEKEAKKSQNNVLKEENKPAMDKPLIEGKQTVYQANICMENVFMYMYYNVFKTCRAEDLVIFAYWDPDYWIIIKNMYNIYPKKNVFNKKCIPKL